MLFHPGTTPKQAQAFLELGIDCYVLQPRAIHKPQDGIPGLFVTPIRWVARRFGLCTLEVEAGDLKPPPMLAGLNVSLEDSLKNPLEPQAFLTKRLEPKHIKIVECHENGYSRNPYEPDE